MSVDFYPRKRSSDGQVDHVWTFGGTRYPFQHGVASLHGADHASEFGEDLSEAWYAAQRTKMTRMSPHLYNGGFDLSYPESIHRAVLQDPVGLDFRMPSAMQAYLDSTQAVNANPHSAPFTTHPEHHLRNQPKKITNPMQLMEMKNMFLEDKGRNNTRNAQLGRGGIDPVAAGITSAAGVSGT